MEARIRLYLDHPLGPGQPVPLTQPQAHYLFAVMRQGRDDAILGFNGRDGEWRLRIAEAARRGGLLLVEDRVRPQVGPPDLWLLFAPVKKARTDFIVEKAVELGAARLVPVQTAFTNSERIRQDRLQAHAVEAAEQCGALTVPPGVRPGAAGPRVGRVAGRSAPGLLRRGRRRWRFRHGAPRTLGPADRPRGRLQRRRAQDAAGPPICDTESALVPAYCAPILLRWLP